MIWSLVLKLERLVIFKLYSRFKKYRKSFLLRFLIYSNPNCNIDKSVDFGGDMKLLITNNDAELKIDKNVRFRNFCCIHVHKKGKLRIGESVFFNNYCSINCLDKIEIGSNTIFGEGVKMYDHNHLFVTAPEIIVSKEEFKTSPIKIGKNCWIGSNVTILKGVNVGDNVIIGANNLIYKSVPPNTIVMAKVEYV